MNVEHIALYNIIKHKKYQYLKPRLVPYFTNLNKKLYEIAFELWMRRVDITPDTIKNCINIQPWKETIKKMCLDHAHNIFKMDIIAGGINIPKVLEETYFKSQFELIRDSITNQTHTLDIQKKMILDVSEKILKSKKADDTTYYDEIIKRISEQNKEGKQTDTVKRSIQLECDLLKQVFGNVIYPHIYTITARPNDFKTTVLLNLVSHLEELGKRGIIISFEDNHEVIALKIFAIKSGLDKRELLQQTYSTTEFDNHIPQKSKNIIILDKLRTSRELKVDIDNICNSQDIDYIALDYLQRIKPERGMSDYERMAGVTDTLLEINKQHNIPIFQLSQTDKQQMHSGGLLGLGSEKGSGEIAQNTRFGISLNPPHDGDEPQMGEHQRRIINRYKTTIDAKGIYCIDFEPKSGQMRFVGEALPSYGN